MKQIGMIIWKGARVMEETKNCLSSAREENVQHTESQIRDIDDLIFAGEPVKLHSEK